MRATKKNPTFMIFATPVNMPTEKKPGSTATSISRL